MYHKAYGPVCACRDHFGSRCSDDGDCPDDAACDERSGHCVDDAATTHSICTNNADCPGGEECITLRHLKWMSRRCWPMPPTCRTAADCVDQNDVCRIYYRNGMHKHLVFGPGDDENDAFGMQ